MRILKSLSLWVQGTSLGLLPALPQGHITALIQFHVNLRVNATLIRRGSWSLLAKWFEAAGQRWKMANGHIFGGGRVQQGVRLKLFITFAKICLPKMPAKYIFCHSLPEEVCYNIFCRPFSVITCGLFTPWP